MDYKNKALRLEKRIQMHRIQAIEVVAAFSLLVFFLFNISYGIQNGLSKTDSGQYEVMQVIFSITGFSAWLFLLYRHVKKQAALKELLNGIQRFCSLVLNMNTESETALNRNNDINYDISDYSKIKNILADIEQSEKYYKTLINYKEQVQQERDFYTHILTETPSLVVWLNPDGTIKYCNPALSRSTGYSIQELLGKKWWDVFYANGKDDP